MRKWNWLTRFIAIVISLAMVINLLPADAIASSGDETTPVTESAVVSESQAVAEDDSAMSEPYIMAEVTEERTETTKTFRMSDGSYLAVQYELPVHYQDAFGKWQNYDNTLEGTLDGQEMINRKSDKETRFSKKAKQNKMVRLSFDNYPVAWGYEKINNSPANVIPVETAKDELELTKLIQEVRYCNVYKDVDFQYYVFPKGIKENIILKSREAQNIFTVNYSIGELTAVQKDSRTIELQTEKGKTVYVLSAPELYDSNGETSQDVSFNIVKINGTHISVELTADSQWLQAEERAFPVYLDPLVTISGQRDFSLDCYVVKKKDGTYVNMNDCRDNYVGNTADGVNRLFQKLNLPELAKGDVVTKAVMQLAYVQYEGDNMGAGDYKIDAYEVTQPWTTENISFYQSCDTVSLDYCLVPDSAAWYSWDITKAVKNWYDNGTNNGIMLRGANESGIVGRRFYGNKIRDNSSYAAYRPTLQVYYINTTGLNDFNSYKTIDYGTYGALHINECRGSITYTFEDVGYGGNLLNANIYHVYNSDYKTDTTAYGTGWYLNICEKITELTDDTYSYKIRDEDGTEVYFKKTDTENVFEDEVGRGWTLQKTADTQTPYTLTDKEGNRKLYDGSGKLISVTDSNDNQLMLGYSSELVTSVTDSGGRVTRLNYNNGRLESIQDPAGRSVFYTYSEDGFLTEIRRYNGEDILIHYWNHRLDIVYMNTSKFALGYTDEKFAFLGEGIVGQNYVIKLQAEYHGDEKTIFTHPGVSEDITADDRILEHCVFNAWGQKITNYITDKNGNFLGKVSSNTFTNNRLDSVKTNNKLLETYAVENAVNRISDSSFEREDAWQPIYWAGSNAPDYFAVQTDYTNAYIGQKAARITSSAPMDATVSFYQHIYNLSTGTYTLSGYVKTTNLTGPLGAFLCGTVYYTDGRAAQDYFSEHILGTTDTEVENGWRRVSVTFTVPEENVSYIQLHAGVRYGSTGTTLFDCIQLETGEVANHYNLLENGGMEQTGGWYLNNLASVDGNVGSEFFQGGQSFRMTGEYGKDKNIAQFVDVYGSPNDIYILSAWARADSIPTNGTRRFFLVPMVKYTDGSVKWLELLDFDSYNTEWQYASKAYSVKNGDKQPERIDVYAGYYQNQNTCYFDNIQLIKDRTQSYVYDSEGNLKNAVTVAEENSSYEYAENEVVKAVSTTGSRYYCTYDADNKHLLTATYADGVGYKYNHDAKGNVTQVKAVSSTIQDGGIYALRTAFGNRAVEVAEGGTADGTRIYTLPWTGNTEQQFQINQVNETDYYTLHPMCAPEMVLGVVESGTQAGTQVRLTGDTGAESQQFRFVESSDGTLRLIPKHAQNMCWTTWDAEGAGIEIWSDYELDAKGFVVEVIESAADALEMKTNATYTASGQYLSSLTDTLGNTVSYTYDETKDEQTGYTDAEGHKTAYVHTHGENNTSLVYADKDVDGVRDHEETYALYTSSKGVLTSIETNNNTYYFTYDAYGNRAKSSLGTTDLMESIYNENNGKLTRAVYGNQHQIRYTYDKLNRISELWKDSPGALNVFLYTYNADGNIHSLYEGATDTTTTYTYDTIGRLVSAASTNGFAQYQNYDSYNRIKQRSFTRGGITHTYHYTYNPQQLIANVLLPTGKTLYSTYDGLNRLKQKSLNTTTPLHTVYTYKSGRDGTTSALVDTLTTAEGTYSYSYDKNGNITGYHLNGTCMEAYTYDHLNQLKTVEKGTDTYEYAYDSGGNIQSVILNGDAIKTYVYGDSQWKDKLTAFNGVTITYDAIGNPLQYRNGITFGWKHGRHLASATTEEYNITYNYNIDGIRVQKHIIDTATNQSELHSYNYNGNQLVCESWGNNTMWFLYDESGSAVGFIYNGSAYYYLKNLQGDITGIADASGTIVTQYTYDVWGKVLTVTGSQADGVGRLNPIRYRGYYYDAETGLYYVSSRYYDPEIGRFLNADGYVSTGQGVLGHNMFAYCGNNPINRKDPNGQGWITALVVTVVVVVAVAVVANAVKNAVIDAQQGVSDEEKKVAKKDPVGAIKGNNAKDIANQYQQELYPNTYQLDANQANAFKHAMWNAVMTDKIGEKRAKKFADAHEAPYLKIQPELCEMDLFNNELGRQIALKYAGQGYDVFAQKIHEAIIGGEAYVIMWDEGN